MSNTNWAGHQELEVRCCCDPKKLYGTLQVPMGAVHAGAALEFIEGNLLDPGTGSKVTLKVDYYNPGVFQQSYLAVKSNDYPLETFEALPGFKRARNPWDVVAANVPPIFHCIECEAPIHRSELPQDFFGSPTADAFHCYYQESVIRTLRCWKCKTSLASIPGQGVERTPPPGNPNSE